MSIPKIIHQIWVGSALPDEFVSNLFAWEHLNPEWQCILWTEANRPDLYNEHLYTHAEQYVPAHAVGQFRADILRYELLYNFGGWYADVDTVPLRPLGDLLDGLDEFAVAEDERWIANTVLASVPENPILLTLMEDMLANAEQHKGKPASIVSGPQYLTPRWTGHVDQRTELWFPYSWSHVRLGVEHTVRVDSEAYMIHQWAHQKGLKK